MENFRVFNFLEKGVKNALTHLVYGNVCKEIGNDYRVAKEYSGMVSKKVSCSFHLGTKYENMAMNKDRDFEIEPKQKPNGMHTYCESNGKFERYVLENDKVLGMFYLRIPSSSICSCSIEYCFNNEKVDFNELLEKGIIVKVNHKNGYVAPKQQDYRVVKFENILELSQKGIVA